MVRFPCLAMTVVLYTMAQKLPIHVVSLQRVFFLTAGLLLTFLSTPKYVFIQALVAYSVSDF